MVIHGNSSPIDGNFHGLTLLSKAKFAHGHLWGSCHLGWTPRPWPCCNVLARNMGGSRGKIWQQKQNSLWFMVKIWLKNYFTSNDPHHGIYTFSYWQIFWHSI